MRCLLAIAALGLCSCVVGGSATKRNPYQLQDLEVPGVPEAWNKVRLVEISGSPLNIRADDDVTESLANRIIKRIGHGTDRPIYLAVENVRAVGVTGAHPMLGIAGEFILSGNGEPVSFTLEHSINGIVDRASFEQFFTRVLDDLVQVLVYHPDALNYINAEYDPAPPDPALLTAEDVPVGPIFPTEPSPFSANSEVTSTGRVVWGNRESDSHLGISGVFSGLYQGFFVETRQRSAPIGFGVGSRTALNIGLLRIGAESFERYIFRWGASYGAAIGYRTFKKDDMGYVSHPLMSFLIVPQLGFDWMISPGGDFTFQLLQLIGGATIEADFAFHKYFGATANILLGVQGGVLTFSGSGASNTIGIDPQFYYKPSFDLYVQLPSGRISLGAALDQIQNAGDSDSGPERPIIINFTWQDHFGRGIAYSKSGVDVGGFGGGIAGEVAEAGVNYALPQNTNVLASATSAFNAASRRYREGTNEGDEDPDQAEERYAVDTDGRIVKWRQELMPTGPIAPPFNTDGTPVAPSQGAAAPAPAAPTPATAMDELDRITGTAPAPATAATPAPAPAAETATAQPAATASSITWMVVPSMIDSRLGETSVKTINDVIDEILRDANLPQLAPEKVAGIMGAVGEIPRDAGVEDLTDLTTGAGATHTLIVRVRKTGAAKVNIEVIAFDAANSDLRKVTKDGRRLAMLRLVREALNEALAK